MNLRTLPYTTGVLALALFACSDDAADGSTPDVDAEQDSGDGSAGDAGTDTDIPDDAEQDADSSETPDAVPDAVEPDEDGSTVEPDADGSSEPPAPDPTDDSDDPLAGAWSDEYGVSGVQGDIGTVVYASWVADDGTLYIGGEFTSAFGVEAANFAMFDGTTWSAVGSGPGIVVLDIQAVGDDLFVAGRGASGGFGLPGPTVVMKWDGDAWTEHGSAFSSFSNVYELVLVDGELWAGGDFVAEEGGSQVSALARFDETAGDWVTVDEDLNGALIRSILPTDDGLCISGFVESIDGLTVNNVACRTEGGWQALDSGLNSEVYELHELADGTLMAVGTFSFFDPENPEADSSIGVALWNATAGEWAQLPAGGVDAAGVVRIRTALVDGTDVYFGGSFGVAGRGPDAVASSNVVRYDGTRFQTLDGGVLNTTGITIEPGVFTLAMSGDDLYAGGDFSVSAEGVALGNFGQWDGSQWLSLDRSGKTANGVLGSVRAFASVGNGDVIVAGDFVGVGAAGLLNIARLGGSNFTALGDGIEGGVAAVAVDSDGTIWAAGGFQDVGFTGARNLAYLDEDNNWVAVDDQLNDFVAAIAVCPDGTLVATGSFTASDSVADLNGIAVWDGTAWSSLGTGLSTTEEFSTAQGRTVLCTPDGDIFVGGEFSAVNGVPATNLARFSAGTWTALATLNAAVSSLDWYDGVLYIGGGFTELDGNEMFAVASWDGSTWSPLAAGLQTQFEFSPASVSCVRAKSNGVFAAGYLEQSGDTPLAFAGWFDGTEWHDLAGGLNDLTEACHVDSSRFFVGGPFTTAGGQPSLGIAEWKYAPAEGAGE